MARTFAAALLPALLALCAPGWAHAADCVPDQADKLFHPYGEPSSPCAVDTAPKPKEDKEPNIFADDRGPRKLYNLGLSGIEGGATLAGLGGFLYVLSLFLDRPSRGEEVSRIAGISVAAVGGAMFLTGGALLIADAVTAPTPTPDGKGAQLTVAFRW